MAVIYEQPLALPFRDSNGVMWFLQYYYVSATQKGFHVRKSINDGLSYTTVYTYDFGADVNRYGEGLGLHVDGANDVLYCSGAYNDDLWRLWEIDVTSGLESLVELYTEAWTPDTLISTADNSDCYFIDSAGGVSVIYTSFFTSMGSKWQSVITKKRGVTDWSGGVDLELNRELADRPLKDVIDITTDRAIVQTNSSVYQYVDFSTQTIISDTGIANWSLGKFSTTWHRRGDIFYDRNSTSERDLLEVTITDALASAGSTLTGTIFTNYLYPDNYVGSSRQPYDILWVPSRSEYLVHIVGYKVNGTVNEYSNITFFVDTSGVQSDEEATAWMTKTNISLTNVNVDGGPYLAYNDATSTITIGMFIEIRYQSGPDLDWQTYHRHFTRTIAAAATSLSADLTLPFLQMLGTLSVTKIARSVSADLILPMLIATGNMDIMSFNIISALQLAHTSEATKIEYQGLRYAMYVDGALIPMQYFTLRKYVNPDGSLSSSVDVAFSEFYFDQVTNGYGSSLRIVSIYNGVELDLFVGFVDEVKTTLSAPIVKSVMPLTLTNPQTIYSKNEMYYRIVQSVKTFRSEPNYNVTIGDLFMASDVQQIVQSVTIFESLTNRFMEVT